MARQWNPIEDLQELREQTITRSETIHRFRTRWQAALYTSSGKVQDWKVLFDKHDKDRNGSLDKKEFLMLCRKALKIPQREIADGEIVAFFDSMDANNDGTLQLGEVEKLIQTTQVGICKQLSMVACGPRQACLRVTHASRNGL